MNCITCNNDLNFKLEIDKIKSDFCIYLFQI